MYACKSKCLANIKTAKGKEHKWLMEHNTEIKQIAAKTIRRRKESSTQPTNIDNERQDELEGIENNVVDINIVRIFMYTYSCTMCMSVYAADTTDSTRETMRNDISYCRRVSATM